MNSSLRYSVAPLLCLFLLICLVGDTQLFAQGQSKPGKSLAEELPRIPPTEPGDAVKTFKLEHSFQMELVAGEPDVADPVDACFDENGRMYVAEMHGYPFSSEPTKYNPKGNGTVDAGIIRLLEDTDGDGRMDSSHVFAKDISWPISVCCYRGGVFVLAPSKLYYLKDTDGDNVADVRKIVYSGFSRANVQALANNMKWGLDNRIYAAGGRNGGTLMHGERKVGNLSGRDICFDPKTEAVEFISGGAQFGHSMDDWGNRFVCNNSDHIRHVVFENRYLKRNRFLGVSGVTRSIAKGGPAAPVYRRSPPEPWRIVRTRRRVSDPARAARMSRTERFATGFFTSAAGVTVYRGSAYPAPFRGNVFIGDVGGNLVHRKTLRPKGAGFVATRADEKTEFVASTDNWFRPVNFANAPDGTLFILDMYRETIEHPFSIPEDMKKHLFLESGNDRGRIWRLVSPGMKRTAVPKLGGASIAQLVAELKSPNSWNRLTAQRLLVERQDRAAIRPLQAHILIPEHPLARIHALWTLEGLEATDVDILKVALADPHARVREQALRVAERHVADSPELADAMLALLNDKDARVRFQLAFSLGEIKSAKAVEAMTHLAKTITNDADLRTALLTSVSGNADALCVQLLKDSKFVKRPGALDLIGDLARIVGSQKEINGHLAVLDAVLDVLASRDDSLQQQWIRIVAVLKPFEEGLKRHGSSMQKLLAREPIDNERDIFAMYTFAVAAVFLENQTRPQGERRAAVEILAFADFETAEKALKPLLTPLAPRDLQIAAVRSLAENEDPRVGAVLLSEWGSYSPEVRREVVDNMLSQQSRVETLLATIEAGDVKSGEIERDKKQLLQNHPNDKIRARARKLFCKEVSNDRVKVIAAYQKALDADGSAERGKKIYMKNCSVCHKVGGEGHQVGPDLASTRNKSPRDMLIAILDPNREAQPNYTSYNVQTVAGKTYSGMIAAETANSITLRRAEGKQNVILRSNIEQLQSSGLSLMPVGLEKEITEAQMADLLEFVKTIKPAEKKK